MRRDGLMLTLPEQLAVLFLPGGASLTGLTAYTKSFDVWEKRLPG